jgi:hypothetical protein
MESLIHAIDIVENNKKKINYCNGWWPEKILNFKIKSKYNDARFLCQNLAIKNTEHLMWNNEIVCHECICIGNRLYALKYFYIKIMDQLIQTNPLLLQINFHNFIIFAEQKLKNMSLNILTVPKVYTEITNIYKSFFLDPIPILDAIRNFEEIYNPNIYIKDKCLTNKNEQYLSMKKLLERSK